MKRTGILLMNLGGPNAPEDVKPFLFRLFRSEDILVGVPAPLRTLIALLISAIKGGTSVHAYESSHSFGVQLHWTEKLRNSLASSLKIPVEIGMGAWHPFIEEGLLKLRRAGVEQILLFPLFPQYSTTTTGSCLKDVRKTLTRWGWNPELQIISSWATDQNYIDAIYMRVKGAIQTAKEKLPGHAPHVLFSAHSLPMKIVNLGDPYPEETKKTLEAIVSRGLGAPHSLAFQSRNGRLPWLSPYTEDEIQRLGKEGVKNLVVVPISFVSDHIETLEEIDIRYAALARENGILNFTRSRSLNADPDFLEAVHSLALRNLGV